MKYYMNLRSICITVAAAALLLCIGAACQSSSSSPPVSIVTPPPVVQPQLLSPASTAPAAQGRAQLWSQTCNRCHNTRSPDSYSGSEWAIVMTHMRVRGYLTGPEQRAILEFLQAQ
jgi:cytochrome c5